MSIARVRVFPDAETRRENPYAAVVATRRRWISSTSIARRQSDGFLIFDRGPLHVEARQVVGVETAERPERGLCGDEVAHKGGQAARASDALIYGPVTSSCAAL